LQSIDTSVETTFQAAAADLGHSRSSYEFGRLAPLVTESSENLTERRRAFEDKRKARMTTSAFVVGSELLRQVLQQEIEEGLNPQEAESDLDLPLRRRRSDSEDSL